MIDYFTDVLDYAFDHGIGITLCREFSPYTPSGANPERKQIVINMNWYKPRQLAYMTAHEVSHVLHHDSGYLYFSGTARTPIEADANHGAVDILVPIYFREIGREDVDLFEFMHEFDLPSYMEDYTTKRIRSFYKKG